MLPQETRELPAGTIVRLFGIPLALASPAMFTTAVDNWQLIEASRSHHGDERTQATLFVTEKEHA